MAATTTQASVETISIWIPSLMSAYGESLHDVPTQEEIAGDGTEDTDAQSEQVLQWVSREYEDPIYSSDDEIQTDKLSEVGQDRGIDNISSHRRYGQGATINLISRQRLAICHHASLRTED